MPRVLVPDYVAPATGATAYTEESGDLDLSDVRFFVPQYMSHGPNLDWVERMPRLEVLQLLTAGYESALPYVRPGVTLCNAAGVHDASTAELAVGLILASQRGIDDAVRAMPSGAWVHATRPSLADRRVLIVGAGGVGQAIRRRLEHFEVEVVMVATSARAGVHASSELPALLPDADVVVLAVPLTSATAGLVDTTFLERMPDGALLVNVARGPVVDTDALVAQVAAGRIRAALDVTDPEPLPAGHPLWGLPGVLITPHVGGNTSAFVPRARALVAEQLRRFSGGERLLSVVSR
jgi:phosphoglycerate dehydrogenase-like enzyme